MHSTGKLRIFSMPGNSKLKLKMSRKCMRNKAKSRKESSKSIESKYSFRTSKDKKAYFSKMTQVNSLFLQDFNKKSNSRSKRTTTLDTDSSPD